MKTTKTARNTETAAQAYDRTQREVAAMIAMLQAEMKNHAKRQAADPRNWEMVGDLEHVRGNLRNLLTFARNAQNEEIEGARIDREVAARIA